MNKFLLKYTSQTNQLFVSSFVVVIMSMILLLAWLFPTLAKDASYAELLQNLPEQLRSAFGVVGNQTNYYGFMSANYFNSLHLYFMMAFVIMLGQQVISKPIDDTSLSYFLSGNLSRRSYFTTQTLYFIGAVLAVTLSSWITMAVGALLFAPEGATPWRDMSLLHVMLFGVFIFYGAIVFLVRTLATNGKMAVSISASIIVLEYCLSMASALTEKLAWLKYLTLFSLLDISQWNHATGPLIFTLLVLFVSTGLLFVASGSIFNRKDLYL